MSSRLVMRGQFLCLAVLGLVVTLISGLVVTCDNQPLAKTKVYLLPINQRLKPIMVLGCIPSATCR